MSDALTEAISGISNRFTDRWHFIGAGISNAWNYGDLEFDAPSGRLLARGPNGTGKTTALEMLMPYLLDLNGQRLVAGKGRTTTLASLMREGSTGNKRIGYVWMTLKHATEGEHSFGVRLQFSENSSPAVQTTPFRIPGRPIRDLKLYGPGRSALTREQFEIGVSATSGQVFEDEDEYVSYLSVTVFGTRDRQLVPDLTQRIRQIRDPSVLTAVTPTQAATALRVALPAVAEEVVSATAEALAESDATREAFERDKEAAELLTDFRATWTGHVVEVATQAWETAKEAAKHVRALKLNVAATEKDMKKAEEDAGRAEDEEYQAIKNLEIDESQRTALKDLPAYKDSRRLEDLKATAQAKIREAEACLKTLSVGLSASRREEDNIQIELNTLIEDLQEQVTRAESANKDATPKGLLVHVQNRPRAVIRVGDSTFDPGPELHVKANSSELMELATSWKQLSGQHEMLANTAHLMIKDHGPVEQSRIDWTNSKLKSDALLASAETAAAKASQAERESKQAAELFLKNVIDWTEANGRLTYNLENDDSVWDKDAIEEISQSESSQVLAEGENWSRHAMFVAQSLASDLNARARTALEEAATLHTESNQRREEAAQLRAGKLLPLPRPAWCEEGDDSIALGSALDWKDSITSAERDLLEATFAASGLLGASLGHEGAATGSWRVEPSGPKVSPNLLEVLSVDPGHDFAKEAAAVLERIQLVSSLTEAKSDSLTFAKDGTFQAGVLRARVPGADDPAKLEVASHVGARQRKEAALARAIHLEAEAKGLETSAATLELTAHNQKNEAQAFITAADAFPSVSTLRSRESQRANLADLSKEAREKAEEAAFKTDDLHGLYKRAEAEWVERVRGLGLPRSLNELKELKEKERERADALSAASRVVSERLYKRLERILSRHSELKSNESAKSAQNQAIASERSASDARTSVETLEKNAGAAIKDVLRQLSELDRKVSQAQAKLDSLRSEKLEQVKKHASAITQHDNAKNRYEEEKPTEARTVGALRDVVALPGIVEVLLTEEPLSDDKEFLEQVEAKLAGKKTVSNKTVRTSVDNLKSKLAGRWGIDPGESHPELLTYVLTHRDTSYTPASAAAHAESLRTRAQEALDAQEQKALMDFVLGRLPMAISVAWHQLHDWTREVNRKMRETTASSGVGVQVRTPLRDDMEGPSREVYDLCCRISDVERTPEQQARLANALKALIYSSPGETMLERVTSAVNISEWVDVIYEVTRPGGKIQRWGSKTGLSSGEKRLVVLAPMLAAIAASYDRLGEGVLRIVALDEVPTEVDEKGKEGLARYIAQLDLDLICTSYLWDGCPGAWDGIDAYDLEEGPDGTVVGYPMLVRGLIPLPGDKYYLGSHEPVGTTPL